jgi:23S rRNA-intervening sequence protein
MGMSYRDLEIWDLARQIAVAVHRMTLQDLPKFEAYEEGSQIRRSAKSIRANIVEGYGRKLNVFIDSVEHSHRTGRSDISDPGSRIARLAS